MLVLGKNFQILTVMVNHGGNSGKRVQLCKIIINILNTYIYVQYELRYTSHQFTTCIRHAMGVCEMKTKVK